MADQQQGAKEPEAEKPDSQSMAEQGEEASKPEAEQSNQSMAEQQNQEMLSQEQNTDEIEGMSEANETSEGEQVISQEEIKVQKAEKLIRSVEDQIGRYYIRKKDIQERTDNGNEW